MAESDWWQQHRILSNEVTNTVESFYTWKHVNNYAAESDAALRQMNRDPTFWNIALHALQTTFIITVGRVFDKDPRSHSIQKLLAKMVAHPEYFSKQALERRKREAGGNGDFSWLPNYLRDAWEPTPVDLEQLRDALNPTIAKYEAVYEPIRHKIFAHRDIGVDTDALLGKSLVADVEQILYALHDILEAIWQLQNNGERPKLGVRKYDFEERIRKTTGNVMASLTVSLEC